MNAHLITIVVLLAWAVEIGFLTWLLDDIVIGFMGSMIANMSGLFLYMITYDIVVGSL